VVRQEGRRGARGHRPGWQRLPGARVGPIGLTRM
jgi:hypothetical protein